MTCRERAAEAAVASVLVRTQALLAVVGEAVVLPTCGLPWARLSMKVLVACEFSGIVRDAFRARGHDAWSCDLLPSERPGPHIQENVLEHLEGWDLIIAHPPCQFLSLAGNVWLKQPGRLQKRMKAFAFFMALFTAPCARVAVENPRGYPSRAFRKPDQIIQPYQFGHEAHKPTCLWLRDLPLLQSTNVVRVTPKFDGRRNRHWVDRVGGGGESGWRNRSRTFQGIADAMADQWGSL